MGLHEFTIISYLFFQLGYSKRREEIQRGIEIDVDGSSWHFLPADWETAGTSNRNSRYRGYRGFARQPRCIAGTIKIFCKRKRKKNLLFLPYNMAVMAAHRPQPTSLEKGPLRLTSSKEELTWQLPMEDISFAIHYSHYSHYSHFRYCYLSMALWVPGAQDISWGHTWSPDPCFAPSITRVLGTWNVSKSNMDTAVLVSKEVSSYDVRVFIDIFISDSNLSSRGEVYFMKIKRSTLRSLIARLAV